MTNLLALLRGVGRLFESAFRFALVYFIGAYRTLGTLFLGGSCRFEPSCSEYAMQAVQVHPPLRAAKLVVLRICKCRPGGPFGLDPVPPVED